MTRRRRSIALVVAAALSIAMAGCSSGSPSDVSTTSAAYQLAYRTGLQAYVYGLPLLVTNATFQTMTSVDVSQGAYGPVNQFNNVRTPNTSKSNAVVAMGATSLSSIAWVDLTAGPQVLHVPTVTGHYFVLALIDPYTENLVNLGSATSTPAGDYVLEDPQQRGAAVPASAKATVLPVDYSRIWIIGSTQLLNDGSDVDVVDKIQDGYTLTPLSQLGTDYQAPAVANPRTTITKHVPPTGIQFFDQLGQLLTQFPPPSADAAALASFAAVGIGPGRTPSTDSSLSADTRQGLADAAAAGPQQVLKDTGTLFARDFPVHDGYLLGGFGRYGTDYAERAVITDIGLGAFVPHQAIYAMTWTDSTKKPLTGASSYVVHLTTPPPTNEGWSLTTYTLSGGLVPSKTGHDAITNISPLTRNADGSIDIYLQSTPPTSAAKLANWIATPAAPSPSASPSASTGASSQGFELTWRLFAPDAASIPAILSGSGWQPPAVEIAG